MNEALPAFDALFVSMMEPLSSNPVLHLLSNRTRTRLQRAAIFSLADLIEWDEAALLGINGFGVGCLNEVNRFLEANGLLPVRDQDASATPRPIEEPKRRRALPDRTRTILIEAGVSADQDPRDMPLEELLALPGVDYEVIDDLVAAGLTPRPRDPLNLLLLLVASEAAQYKLRGLEEPYADALLSSLERIRRNVEEQVERGPLHRKASMDWKKIQAFNGKLRPPEQTLTDLLSRLQYLPGREAAGILDDLEGALDVPTIEEEISSLLDLLDEREVGVLRVRFAVDRGPTLEEAGVKYGVTRERIRQVEKRLAEKLRETYYWGPPLLRMRTAVLLVNELGESTFDGVRRLLVERGLATSEAAVADFLAIWRAVAPTDSAVSSTLVEWRAVNPHDFAFPEDILDSAKDGLTLRQRNMSDEVKKAANRRLRVVGVVDCEETAEELKDYGASADDIAAVLSGTDLSEIAPRAREPEPTSP